VTGAEPPGVQAQRTSLAWSRTALSVVVVAVLLVRTGLVEHRPETIFGAAALLGGAFAMWWTGRDRARDGDSEGAPIRRAPVLLCSIVTVAAGFLAAASALSSSR
jgi:uncharacterized membrane protein YidH (DUF202 family)